MFKTQWFTMAGTCAALVLLPISDSSADDGVREISIPEVGMGLGGVAPSLVYFPFADIVRSARWQNVSEWDENGWPAAGIEGEQMNLRAGVNEGGKLPAGIYTVKWEGDGDVTQNRAIRMVDEDLSGPVKVRRYEVAPSNYGVELHINSLPVTNLRWYQPGQEDYPDTWNPIFVDYLMPFAGGPLRFMDLNGTNNSRQAAWSDRTQMSWPNWAGNHDTSTPEVPHKGVIPYEAMVELANTVGMDMWITVPHAATDEHVANLAHLIRTGIDRATGQQTGEPLREDLRVWVEYSNEVWARFTASFQQGDWVFANIQVPAGFAGNIDMSNDFFAIDVKYAYRTRQIFRIFEEEFGGVDSLVRVLGTQTGWGAGQRSRNRMQLLDRSDFDVLAKTSYFSYDMQLWIYENWNGGALTVGEAIDEFKRRIGSGPLTRIPSANEHPDNTNSAWHYFVAEEFNVPVVTYEGGDHLNAVARHIPPLVQGERNRTLANALPESVDFIHAMMRDPRFKDVYRAKLDREFASGLRLHMPFVLIDGWSQWGQWGHLEYLPQPVDEAPAYQFLMEYFGLFPHSRYSDWVATNFSVSETTAGGTLTDPLHEDEHGVTNLYRYATGLARGQSPSENLMAMTVAEDGQPAVEFTYNPAAVNPPVFLELSSDLNTWHRSASSRNLEILAQHRNRALAQIKPAGSALNPTGPWFFRIQSELIPNNPPVASLNASQLAGEIPFDVIFDASGSSDPDGDSLTYLWDFGNGFNVGTATQTLTIEEPGTYEVSLRVSDGDMTDTATVTIIASDFPPTPPPPAPAGLLAVWDFVGTDGAASSPADAAAPGLQVSSARIGPGLTPNSYRDGAGLTGRNRSSMTLAEAIDEGQYIKFSISPTSGKEVSVTAILVSMLSQNDPSQFALLSSIGGFTTDAVLGTMNFQGNSGSPLERFEITGHDNLTGIIEFRIYMYGVDNPYGSVGLGVMNNHDDLVIEGNVQD